MTAGLLRVSVRVPIDEREEAIAVLLGLTPTGFEESDCAGESEFSVYTDAAGESRLRSVFERVETTSVAPGWEDGWRRFHQPVTAGGLWIGPPWLEPPPKVLTVVIDPGRAFGTGAHPTTRLCVELLAGIDPGSLLDVGCGSGVLSIAAARLGFGPIAAIDDDPVAVEVALANARANGVELDARVLDAFAGQLPAAAVAVANVLLRPVEAIIARLDVTTVVTSGYLEGEVPAHPGWLRNATLTLGGWAADRFDRA